MYVFSKFCFDIATNALIISGQKYFKLNFASKYNESRLYYHFKTFFSSH